METNHMRTGHGKDETVNVLNVDEDADSPDAYTKDGSRVVRFIRDNLILLLTVIGVLLGLGIGFAIRPLEPSEDALMWIGLPGKLYLHSLKMMIVPLIICSVISGTASLDAKTNGRITVVAFVFIFLTNTLSSLLGVASSLTFRPGTRAEGYVSGIVKEPMETQDIFADLLRNMVPDNLIQATFSQTQTKYSYKNETVMRNTSAGIVADVTLVVSKRIGSTGGVNLLGLILACTLLGMASVSTKTKSTVFIAFFTNCTDICIVVIRWLMWSTPIGVLCLIIVAIADVSDIGSVFSGMGMFIATVVVAIAVQQIIVFPLIYFCLIRKNPFKFYVGISKPWLIAFAAASTAVTIPEMLWSCEVHNKVDKRVARFVIPFCVTLSANGSAVFISSSCIFIANMTGMTVTTGDVITIGMLSAVSSLAIPSVPSSSIVTIIMILSSMSIPIDAVALLLAMDWLLDRLRTTSGIISNVMCAIVTNKLCQHFLKRDGEDFPLDAEILVNGSRDHLNIEMQNMKDEKRPVANDSERIVKT